MSTVKVQGNASGTGSITLASPNTNSNRTINLPDADGSFVTADGSGNVGIGTSVMTGKFNVSAGRAFFAGNSEQYSIGVGYNQTRVGTGAQVYYIGATDSATPALVFSEAGGAEKMRLDSSGNLLVGTTTAQATGLTVQKAAGSNPVAYFYNNSNASGDAAAYFALGANANNTSSFMLVCTQPGTRNVMYIYGNGNIVNQNNSYGVLSDVKLKENIVDATPKLADVMRLQVRNYNLKTDPNQKQIGFVAQELEQVFPGMVDESPDLDENGNALDTFTKSIKTSVLVPILVKAIQEQQVMIEEMKAEIAALKGATQ